MARNAWIVMLTLACCTVLRAADAQESQDATITRVIDEKKELGKRLIQVIRSLKPLCPKPDRFLCAISPEIKAIEALGELREADAVRYLLDIIDLEYTRGVSCTSGDREVIQALTDIGKPASKAAIDFLATDDSARRAYMYVRVITNVEGIQLGREMVRLAAESEKDSVRKARLFDALELFKEADWPIP